MMNARLVLPLLTLLSLQPNSLAQDERFTTDRESDVELPLAEEDDSFTFAVFGDRTGGPAEGVKVLSQAVDEVNLFDPDLVMTVGDLVEGYNTSARWQRQADEFSGIMNRLTCPWYPVAGNHDVYWRGDGKPEGEHEANYERHFGPLWYAFRHKDCWFITLYTDEGNPQTGEKTFRKPASQRMSEAQVAFLDQTLERARDARHVFVFLHHPRWHGGGYGNDWERIHTRLAAAGNVTAVFAGHIHHMVYDGVRDGIEYFTLATVGGHQPGDAAEAGYLHHWNLITVRDEGLAVVTLPVGAAMDPRLITAEVARAARRMIDSVKPGFSSLPIVSSGVASEGVIGVEFRNPLDRDIEVQLSISSQDGHWDFRPDHDHFTLPAGGSRAFEFQTRRGAARIDAGYKSPEIQYQLDYLAETHRVSLPSRAVRVPIPVGALPTPTPPAQNAAFDFDGRDDCLKQQHTQLELHDGPFTIEGWFNGDDFSGRRGLLNKTESSEFGIFLDDGHPSFLLHIAGRYVSVLCPEVTLEAQRWYHIAGVFDGSQTRLYLDGKLIGSQPASGTRTQRNIPLIIGADTDASGGGNSYFDGRIDEVRLSKVARYTGEAFRPMRLLAPDPETLLLLHLDERLGEWAFDASQGGRHPTIWGRPQVMPAH